MQRGHSSDGGGRQRSGRGREVLARGKRDCLSVGRREGATKTLSHPGPRAPCPLTGKVDLQIQTLGREDAEQ